MSLNLSILQVLKHREQYERLHRTVNHRSIDPRTKVIIQDFGKYFDSVEDCEVIPVTGAFADWFTMVAHRTLSDEDRAIYRRMFSEVEKEPSQAVKDMLVSSLLEADLAVKLADAVAAYTDEQEIDLPTVLRHTIEQYDLDVKRKVKLPLVEADDSLFDDDTNNTGFRWRWRCLNESMRPLRPGDFGILAGRPDRGKCLDPDTPVLLANGDVVPAKDVKEGDVLAGPYRNNRVLGTTKGRDTMYRVTYPWGESYVVNSEHILSLKRSKAEGKHRTGDVLNVPVKEYIDWPAGRKERYKGWKSGVDYPEAALPMDPYLLGLWLGDGTRGKPQITTVDAEILAAFEHEYGEPSACYKDTTYAFYGTRMIADLRAAGVFNAKHVPEQYLRASREQRLALLAGLIDSDGHAGDMYELVSVSDRLRDGYVRLARSLGFHATSKPAFKRAVGTAHEGSWYWRVWIGSEAFGVVPVRLSRKLGNSKKHKRAGLHFGITVEEIGPGEYAGFSLDGDHLFLLGDYTVTHNTSALTDNITFMAQQMDEVYGPDNGRSILWLNNEGPGSRILKRCVQSALGKTTSELVTLKEQGKLWSEYAAAIGGDIHRIKVFNIHGMKSWQVEEILRQVKPALVVFDMIDNVNFDGAVINGGQRTDQLLEGMYQWARELAVRFECPIIATSQISADGDGLAYPTLTMLKDSKCFAAGTPVRMADGTVRAIETIKVGEQVMGIDGTPRNVVGTGQGEEPMYRVSGKGWSFDCNESHNLVVQNRTRRRTAGLDHGEMRDMSLREFMGRGSSKDRLTAVRCRIPYQHQDLLIEPYLFGLWLGDGNSRGLSITTGDDAIQTYLEALPTYRHTYQNRSNCVDVYVGGRKELKALGVYQNKRVPQVYKTASVQQRLSLLAGIMDSDGHRDASGSMVVAMSDRRIALIDDIEEVARSLGYRCSQKPKASTNSVTLYIANTDELPVLLDRKRGVCRVRGDRMKVEPIGWGKYYGITVDGDSRYCHAKYIALRNTGKQGAADFIITIGAKNEPGFEALRFIGLTKNKLEIEGKPKSPKAELLFDGPTGRYVEG